MKVICKFNTGVNLLKTTYEIGYIEETEFELTINETYKVYGMCIWKNSLHFLIIGKDENFPSWYPAELFKVSNYSLPFEWYFNTFSESEISAIWGYEELVLDENHFDLLMERNKKALEIFLKRKHELDEFLNY